MYIVPVSSHIFKSLAFKAANDETSLLTAARTNHKDDVLY